MFSNDEYIELYKHDCTSRWQIEKKNDGGTKMIYERLLQLVVNAIASYLFLFFYRIFFFPMYLFVVPEYNL